MGPEVPRDSFWTRFGLSGFQVQRLLGDFAGGRGDDRRTKRDLEELTLCKERLSRLEFNMRFASDDVKSRASGSQHPGASAVAKEQLDEVHLMI